MLHKQIWHVAYSDKQTYFGKVLLSLQGAQTASASSFLPAEQLLQIDVRTVPQQRRDGVHYAQYSRSSPTISFQIVSKVLLLYIWRCQQLSFIIQLTINTPTVKLCECVSFGASIGQLLSICKWSQCCNVWERFISFIIESTTFPVFNNALYVSFSIWPFN